VHVLRVYIVSTSVPNKHLYVKYFSIWEKSDPVYSVLKSTIVIHPLLLPLLCLCLKDGKCTPTLPRTGRMHIKYADCISVKDWNMKFCATCKRNRCCYPRKERTREMEFQCAGGRRETFSFLWIKSCRCDKECYKHPAVNAGRSRRNKQKRQNRRKFKVRRRPWMVGFKLWNN